MSELMEYAKVARAWTYLFGESYAVMHYGDTFRIVRSSELPGEYHISDVAAYCHTNSGLPYSEARGANVCGLPKYHKLRQLQPRRRRR